MQGINCASRDSPRLFPQGERARARAGARSFDVKLRARELKIDKIARVSLLRGSLPQMASPISLFYK